MSTTSTTDRRKLLKVWQASQDPRQHQRRDDAFAHQLALIEKRILRSSAHAHTSNRARGAVRIWTHRRAALIRRAAEAACQAGEGNDAAQQAEKLLLAGAPQHLRVEESQARTSMELAMKQLQQLDPESLPADFKRATDVLRQAHAKHAEALWSAISWEAGG
jgi:hypothetical protein